MANIIPNQWQSLDALFGSNWFTDRSYRSVLFHGTYLTLGLQPAVFSKDNLRKTTDGMLISFLGEQPSLEEIMVYCERESAIDYRTIKHYLGITFWIDPVPERDMLGNVFSVTDFCSPERTSLARTYCYRLLVRSLTQTFVSEPAAIMVNSEEVVCDGIEFSVHFSSWSSIGSNQATALYLAKKYPFKDRIEIMLEDKFQ